MAMIPAKCTNCGANIQVDKTKEAGICESCGTAFITEKAINNYNILKMLLLILIPSIYHTQQICSIYLL